MANTSSLPNTAAPWANPPQRSGRHLFRKIFPWLMIIAVVGLIVAGLWPKPIEVETGSVVRSPLTVSVLEEGKTRIRNRYIVATPVAGMMKRVSLRPGDTVKAQETVLTSIEPTTAPLLDPRARQQAEAAIALQVAASQRTQEMIKVAKIAQQRADAELQRINAEKTTGLISQSDRERIEADAGIRAAEVRAIEFEGQIREFELAQARAMLSRPATQLTENVVEIKAPVSGVVLRVMQESEMIVNPGQQILEIGDPTDLEVEAEILSRDAVSIRLGANAFIEQWGADAPLNGKVRRIEPAAFTKISSLGVEEQRVLVLIDLVSPPDEARTLGDRFRVEARIATWHSEDALVVPSSALFRENNTWKTYRVIDAIAHKCDVSVGHSDGRKSEVISGLNEGDCVLLHPPDAVKDLSKVVEK
jgi:HlyD family secretion protein